MINTGDIDTEPPYVQSISVDTPVLDVTSTEQQATFTFSTKSDLSGLQEFTSSVSLLSPNLEGYDSAALNYRNRVSGDYHAATYTFTVTIPAGSVPGVYPLSFLLIDDAWLVGRYGPRPEETPLPAGLPQSITVINNGVVDSTPPAMTSIEVTPAEVNVTDYGSAEIIVQATDGLSGISEVLGDGVHCGLIPAAGGPIVNLFITFQRTAGTARDGTWRGRIVPLSSTPLGQYTLSGIYLIDALGNVVGYCSPSLGLTPFPGGSAPVITLVSNPVPGPYQVWMSQFPSLQGADATRTADPDGDGYPNLVELALGLNPTIPQRAGRRGPESCQRSRHLPERKQPAHGIQDGPGQS